MSTLKRRALLRHGLCAAAGSALFSSLPFKLAMAQRATEGRTLLGNDYRALVCIYLFGGNDPFNMVVPVSGAPRTAYAATRTNLALAPETLLGLNPLAGSGPSDGGVYGLHPAMTGLRTLFNQGRAAIVNNVGPLVRPTSKALYSAGSVPLPAQLFSHSDQTVLWQTPRADTSQRLGWGGRLADIFYASNSNQVLSMNVSMFGENVFQAGTQITPYFMSPFSVEEIDPISTSQTWNAQRRATFEAIHALQYTHPFEQFYAQRVDRMRQTTAQVKDALATVPDTDPLFHPFWTEFGLNPTANPRPAIPHLARQLLMVARMIRLRATLGMSRQLFFAGLGGFDTHDTQLEDHPALLTQLSQSLKAFYDVLANPIFNVAQRVTAFTASEFGRTLSNNGDGTDHGWGSHHLVVGGSVRGQRFYGRMPSLAASAQNPDDAGWGQIIPTLAADQYAATLATWFGLSSADRPTLFPNLQHYTGSLMAIEGADLGFMTPVG